MKIGMISRMDACSIHAQNLYNRFCRPLCWLVLSVVAASKKIALCIGSAARLFGEAFIVSLVNLLLGLGKLGPGERRRIVRGGGPPHEPVFDVAFHRSLL